MNEDYLDGWGDMWDAGGPIWIDPRFYHQRRVYKRTITTTGTNTTPAAQPLTEEQIRKIVREEMSDLVKPDIPDAPPEDWNG